MNTSRFGQNLLALLTARYQLIGQDTVFAQRRVCLSDNVTALFNSREILDLIRYFAIDNPVCRFQETVLVGAGKQRQRIDQADV